MPGLTQSFLGIPVVAASRAMRKVLDTARLIANSPSTVLVKGESGTGKEVVARAIHCYSHRSEQPWVSLNCTSLPDSMVETELFGREAGAPGLFELAAGGTLFLDEIGDLEWTSQARLAGILDSPTSVRLLAATNQNLEEKVRAGRFRADLFRRLTQCQLSVPPLRERAEDILPLARLFLKGTVGGCTFTDDAGRAMESYPWPGNVRELRNVVHLCAVHCQGSLIRTLDLPERLQDHYAALPEQESDLRRLFQTMNDGLAASDGAPGGAMLQDMEKHLIRQVLAHTGGHQERAAQLLGISRRTLSRKLRQYESENEDAGVEVI